MCRKVLYVYDFPLHHISNIRIFHLIMFRSIRKHWVLKDLYTQLLVIIIGSISWSSKYVRSLWSHIASHTRCYILYLCGTQGHKVLFPAASRNHGKLHGRTSTGCALLVHCTFYSIGIDISCKLKFTLEAYLRPYPIVPHIYLNACFTAIQWVCLDWLMNWLSTFTA